MSVDVASFDVAGTVANGPIAIIPPGTGLGESFLTWDGSQYVAQFQKVATQIVLPGMSVSSVCCAIFCGFGHVWWRGCALESAFPILTNSAR